MMKKTIAQRRDLRIPLDLQGYIKKTRTLDIKRCKVKDISVHGALIHLDEPLIPNDKVQLHIPHNKKNTYRAEGTVRWCKNGTLPYKIGIYFPEEIDIPLSLKTISGNLKKTACLESASLKAKKEETYLNLIKNSSTHLLIGYLYVLFKKEVKELFQSINSKIHILNLEIKKKLSSQNNTYLSQDNITFFSEHLNTLQNELSIFQKTINFLYNLSNINNKYSVNIIEFKDLSIKSINNFYNNTTLLKKISLNCDISNNIPIFIGNEYVFKKALEMIFASNMSYVSFYNANNINIRIYFEYSNRTIYIELINDGSIMFNQDIYLNKNNIDKQHLENIFIIFLSTIILILNEYDPQITIINESGNNKFILEFKIDPILTT